MVNFLLGHAVGSTLSTAMIDLQLRRKGQLAKMRIVRRYLRENLVEQTMVIPVIQQLQDRMSYQERLSKHEVPALFLLSSSM